MEPGVKALIVVLVISGIIVLINLTGSDKKTVTEPDNIELVSMAEVFVKKNLKAPSTAEFCSVREARINKLGNHEYEVRGYVDAQNIFGAMLRSNYYVKMRHNQAQENYNLLNISIE
jgi:hypothetical protein